MGQFGEQLRRERISRGVALETISERTKVVTRYLCALEEEHFDQLPGGILSKGIVRSYASTVGLDESAWVERFLAASRQQGSSFEQDDWVEFVQNVSRSRKSYGRGDLHLRWAAVALLVLVLTGIGWFLWQYVTTREVAAATPAHAVTTTLASTPPSSAPE